MLAELIQRHIRSANGEININIDGDDLIAIELHGKETNVRIRSILSSIEFATKIGLSKVLKVVEFFRRMGFEVKMF